MHRMAKLLSLMAGLTLGAALPVIAQAPAKPALKVAPVKTISSIEGNDLFAAYCAPCHGRQGKGDGPAVKALKILPGDITLLAKKTGGKYSAADVEEAITGRSMTPAHGDSEMPIWGPIFRQMSPDDGMTTLRIANLVKYLESIQQK
jgi:mono/diheme cytochrome c family protein